MKVSNIVISTVSALSMAGALGIAYAQSTYTEPQPGTDATTSQDPSTMNQAPSGTASPDSTAATPDSTGAASQDSTAATPDASGATSPDSTAATPDASSTMSQDATTATPEESTGPSAAPRTYNERVARSDRN